MATTKTPIGKVKPLRGVDYWTEQDKQEIRAEVDAAALSANEAADKANAAALSAETNSSAAEQATTAASEAADKANAATTNAENATIAAQAATTNAVAAVANAETATTNANAAADAANAAATDSVSRTDTAVANAEAATQAANDAAAAANNAAFVIDDTTISAEKVWSSEQIEKRITNGVADTVKEITSILGGGTYYTLGDADNYYCVKNGVCQFSAYISVVQNSADYTVIFSGLPKPASGRQLYYGFSPYGTGGSSESNEPLRISVTADGRMTANNGFTGNSYMVAFTYPVA